MSTHVNNFIFVMTAILVFATTALSQSYNAGYAKYSRGDFKGAERSLLMAVTKETTSEVRARTLKLLGICQYMLGNKSGASRSFKDALGLNPSLVIEDSEVLDPAVVDYFNRVKKDVVKPEVASKPAPTAAPSAPSAAVPVPGVPVAPGTTTAPTAAPQTGAGAKAAGAKKPGTYIVVQTDVPDANVMIDGILAGNTGVQIEVEPGMLMIEVNAPGYEPKFQKVTSVEGEVSNVTIELAKPKKQKKVAKKKPKKPKKTARKKPKSEEDMFGENRGQPQRAGYDAATDFERDTFSGYPAQPTPPGYAPGYGYNQPYEQPYAAPPVAMNNGGYDERYENRAATNNNYFIAVLPFGAGQFQNRSIASGLLFFAAEAGSLAFYIMQDKEAKSTEDDLILFKQQKEAEEDGLTEEDEAYVKETEDYVASTRQKSKYGLYGFGVLWVAGAVEAIINDPVAKAAKQRRRYSRPGYGLEKQERPVLPPEERHYKAEWQVRLIPDQPLPGSGEDQSLKLQWDLRF